MKLFGMMWQNTHTTIADIACLCLHVPIEFLLLLQLGLVGVSPYQLVNFLLSCQQMLNEQFLGLEAIRGEFW